MSRADHELHQGEDVENTSLPAHVKLCNERAEVVGKWLKQIDDDLAEIKLDIKRATLALVVLLASITGTVIYLLVQQHLLQHAIQ